MDRNPTGDSAGADRPGSTPVAEIRRRLLDFYDRDRRDLPWRDIDDPYRTWVSEVMLQQTRVETVIPYYRRWMERFPGVKELAAADLDEVLQEWKGLGYYSRARNLHRAARLVRERHGGRVPSTPEELRELPGVGEYTSGAVASIAYGVAVPAVDGNVRRVLSRLFDLARPGAARLRQVAASLVDPERPGAFNQALMELGARICTPSAPACGACPVEDLCLARARDTVDERPSPRKRAHARSATTAVAVPVDGTGRTLLVRRPEKGLLGGMWEFPSLLLEVGATAVDEAATEGGGGEDDGGSMEDERRGPSPARMVDVARTAARTRGIRLAAGRPARALPAVPHAFSHLRMTYRPFLFSGVELPDGGEDGVRVLPLGALHEAPLPVAQQKIGALALESVER